MSPLKHDIGDRTIQLSVHFLQGVKELNRSTNVKNAHKFNNNNVMSRNSPLNRLEFKLNWTI